MKSSFNKNSGFTLIEVLLAGVILFMVISSTTLIFKGALISSEKAERTAVFSSAIPYLLDGVRQDIRGGNQAELSRRGEGRWLQIDYQWHADLLRSDAPPALIDPESGSEANFPARFKLWNVELTVEIKGYQKHYTYREVSW
jgi:type II secretory pathway pseudopilin PulG